MYSEFLIGNYVSFENEYYKIANIQKHNDKVYYQIEGLENGKKIELKCYGLEPIAIGPHADKITELHYGEEVAIVFAYYGCSFEYIHELQNAYKKWYGKPWCFIM